jgi:3-deoxy-D-manno-octulosonic-acid transferase
MNLKIYRVLSKLLTPFIDLYLLYRKKKGKEDSERFHERLGKASFPRPQGPLVWMHAASIGEAISILPLINKIKKTYPELNILLTTGTVTSSKLLKKKLPKSIIHQYVPVDMNHAVKRFLDHWSPDCAIWVESELWPNLIFETYNTGCPLLLVNGRMSATSFEKWQKLNNLSQDILSCFSLCLAQSEEDEQRFKKAGADNVISIGNLKYEAPALPADPSETGKLVGMIADRPLWIAASTNKGEEEQIIYVHQKLKESHDKILTVIAPRHPERAGDIKKLFTEKGFNVSLRSKSEEINDKTEIYIADTIGEMGIFYRLTGIVFMGGSLVEHGGQNPLEAARLECAIISGNNVDNFRDMYSELEEAGGVVIIKDASELVTKIEELLADHDKQENLAKNAYDFIESKAGILDDYIENLSPYLNPLNKNSISNNIS